LEQLIQVILVSFGIYRLSSLISSEEGLYLGWPKSEQQIGIFKALRIKAGAYYYGPDGLPESNIGRGISCPLCVGFYVTIFMFILMSVRNPVFNGFIIFFGLYGIQTFLANLTSDDAISEAIEEVAENIKDEN